jgi:hypothetical protein
LLAVVLGGSAILLSRVWDSLRTHARGVILAAYGVTVLGFGPVPELRARRLLEHGVQVQGTVVAQKRRRRGGSSSSPTSSRTPTPPRTQHGPRIPRRCLEKAKEQVDDLLLLVEVGRLELP